MENHLSNQSSRVPADEIRNGLRAPYRAPKLIEYGPVNKVVQGGALTVPTFDVQGAYYAGGG